MTTKKDYIKMAEWISENTTPQQRKKLLEFVYFIAKQSDALRGNKKIFNNDRFLQYLNALDLNALDLKAIKASQK